MAITGNGIGHYVSIKTDHAVWTSPLHLDHASAKGQASDLTDEIKHLRCDWCNRPATEVDRIENCNEYSVDPMFIAFCDDPLCRSGSEKMNDELDRVGL